MKVLGVDPGGKGAMALLGSDNSLQIEDMPVFTVKKGRTNVTELNCHALIDILAAWAPDVCYFEQTGGYRGEAAKASYNFGRIAGACEALVKAQHARFHFIAPHLWKRRLGVPGKDNGGADKSRALACDIFPAHAGLFARKKDDGRADAALIAWFGRGRDFPDAGPETPEIFE